MVKNIIEIKLPKCPICKKRMKLMKSHQYECQNCKFEVIENNENETMFVYF